MIKIKWLTHTGLNVNVGRGKGKLTGLEDKEHRV